MRIRWKLAAVVAFAAVCLGGVGLAGARTNDPGGGGPDGSPGGTCLGGSDARVKHVIYLQFDNTHYNRDNPSVASDLEQMPHLFNFLTQNGTLFTNDHTILISHTAGGILSSLTGLYPDRQGQTVSNAYGFYPPSKVPTFTSSFKYWTDKVSP